MSLNTIVWAFIAYILIGALLGGLITLYGISQGQAATWSAFGKLVALWPIQVYRVISGKA